ncbi:SAM-dependent methyltransferase [Actinocorallia sp. API 0066]|uniref:SAM-dependent methyltransferase n=1 Tax=Actinocorallia sp. API 0066 TaxID=2896846 RepID=UPI001E5EFB74|nr:SAM-dependent methyltransferase [Actinocorallia sp. API 0066]MCD0447754.1 SAM-dependent methyltransferase [Actinocorallia sp. API 0066]
MTQLSADRANACRVYDYLIGGSADRDVDQPLIDQLLAVAPTTPDVAKENRSFMQRAVRYLHGEAGITQFLDLGSGIPASGNVHEIAPDATIVYVDIEDVAVERALGLVADLPRVTALRADIRDTSYVLSHPETRRLIDFSKPVALIATGVFPFIPDTADPAGIVAAYRDVCAPGSHLALSHALTAEHWPVAAEKVLAIYRELAQPMFPRSLEQVTAFFAGYTLVEPGLVPTPAWRPDEPVTEDQVAYRRAMAGVGVLN